MSNVVNVIKKIIEKERRLGITVLWFEMGSFMTLTIKKKRKIIYVGIKYYRRPFSKEDFLT